MSPPSAKPPAAGARVLTTVTSRSVGQLLGSALLLTSTIVCTLSLFGWRPACLRGWPGFAACFAPLFLGALMHFVATYGGTTPGIKNHRTAFTGYQNRRAVGLLIAAALIGFYVLLYFHPAPLAGLVARVDPLSRFLRGKAADHWFLYGFLYSLAVLTFGIRFIYRYRHSRYQIIRTLSVIGVQLGLSFVLPSLLTAVNQPDYYFSYYWPLKESYLFPSHLIRMQNHPGGLGMFFFFWGVALSFVVMPVLTYCFGKRWYCSWVCGCGALAETMGDAFRQQSLKTQAGWKFEQISIYSVMVLVMLGTLLVWTNHALGGALLGTLSSRFITWYANLVSMTLAGVVGTGFYSLLGSRVWCRFFCPLAAMLGLIQRNASRFRITVNGDQCMSCGNCSTYCEMGIDVRLYAQEGKQFVRASCVGCGICAEVCPRGVLKLEHGPDSQ